MMTDYVCSDVVCDPKTEYLKYKPTLTAGALGGGAASTDTGVVLCEKCDVFACPGGCYRPGVCKVEMKKPTFAMDPSDPSKAKLALSKPVENLKYDVNLGSPADLAAVAAGTKPPMTKAQQASFVVISLKPVPKRRRLL